MEPPILHADLDAFYASVEQLLNPSLKGKPVVVGGGVVLAASYEARAYGIRAPMSGRDARRLCPDLIVVDGHFERYLEFSDQVMDLMSDCTPMIEQISIDEAFLDVSGSTHLLGSPGVIARRLRDRVLAEVGLPISVGVASTKFLAKIASARAKPDGLVVVPIGSELDFLHPLPVEAMWGVGRVTALRLHQLGVVTIGDLAEIPAEVLGGAVGRSFRSLAWNRDPRRVLRGRRAGSVGSQQALGRGLTDREELKGVIAGIADRVGRRLRKKGLTGATVSLRVRIPGPRTLSRSHTLSHPTASTTALTELGGALLDRAMETIDDRVTLVGMSVSSLSSEEFVQLELGIDPGTSLDRGSPTDLKRVSLDNSVDKVRERFGRTSLGIGSRQQRGVNEEFRKLAERG